MPIYDPKRQMSNRDKMLTAAWFRRINDAIRSHSYPDDWGDYVAGVINRNKTRAEALEAEVYTERVAECWQSCST